MTIKTTTGLSRAQGTSGPRGILQNAHRQLGRSKNAPGKPLDVCPKGFPQTSPTSSLPITNDLVHIFSWWLSNAQRKQAPGFERLVRGNQTQNHLDPSQNSLTLQRRERSWSVFQDWRRDRNIKILRYIQDTVSSFNSASSSLKCWPLHALQSAFSGQSHAEVPYKSWHPEWVDTLFA